MKPDHKNLFASYKPPQPPAGLTEKILLRITQRERRILIAKIGVSASVFICSVSAIVLASRDLIAGLSQSGFFQFASLTFSDFTSIASNFPDFAYSMVESFPIFTAAILLSGIMFALWSMAAFVDEASLLKSYRFSISK